MISILTIFLTLSLLFGNLSFWAIFQWTIAGFAALLLVNGWVLVKLLKCMSNIRNDLLTEFRKLFQPIPTNLSLSGILEELSYVQIKLNGRTLLNGAALHEMIKTFLSMKDSNILCFDIENTNPNPTYMTVPTGRYKRTSRDSGWELEQPKPIDETIE